MMIDFLINKNKQKKIQSFSNFKKQQLTTTQIKKTEYK